MAGKLLSTESIDQGSYTWQSQSSQIFYMVTQDSEKNVPRDLGGSFNVSRNLDLEVLEHYFYQLLAFFLVKQVIEASEI